MLRILVLLRWIATEITRFNIFTLKLAEEKIS